MSEANIEVQTRTEHGKNAARRLRKDGWIPAVLYGGSIDPVSIQVDRRTLLALMRGGVTDHTVFQLQRSGGDQSRHAMIRDMQIDPITREIRHLDFMRVTMTEKVNVTVPIEVVGTATGVKNEDGMLDFVTREVEIECLPGDIPDHLEVDVTNLHVGDHIESKDLTLPDGVELFGAVEDRVIISVSHKKGPADDEAVEGEDEDAEPEVIARGKDEDED